MDIYTVTALLIDTLRKIIYKNSELYRTETLLRYQIWPRTFVKRFSPNFLPWISSEVRVPTVGDNLLRTTDSEQVNFRYIRKEQYVHYTILQKTFWLFVQS